MKGFKSFSLLACGLAIIACASCSTMQGMKQKTFAGASALGSTATQMGSSASNASNKALTSMKGAFASLMPGPKIPVVKARHEDMREIQTGHERALAYQTTKRRGGFFGSLFSGPVDFKEPVLPDAGGMDGSLLPPKAE